MNKNIFLFYVVRAFFLPFFWLPVLYIYLTTNKGLTPQEALFLLSLQELLLIFLEIPTGVLADRVSRRFSVGLGYILTSFPFIFLPFVNSYLAFVAIFFFKAVGKAFISGADNSLLYDSLLDIGKAEEYKKIINRSKAIMMAVTAVCIALGGVLYKLQPESVLILPFPLMLIGAIAAFMMDEPKTSKAAKLIQSSNYLTHIKDSFLHIIKSRELMLLTLVFAVADATAVNMKWYYTPIFEKLKFDVVLIGGITSSFYVIKSLVASVSNRFLDKDNYRNISRLLLFTAMSFALMAIFFNQIMVIATLLLVIFFTENLDPCMEEEIHNKLDSKIRSTAMSSINLFSSLAATLSLNIFGFIQTSSGVRSSVGFLSILFLVPFIAVVSAKIKRN